MLLKKEELTKISGGGNVAYGIAIGIGGLITFLIGVFGGQIKLK